MWATTPTGASSSSRPDGHPRAAWGLGTIGAVLALALAPTAGAVAAEGGPRALDGGLSSLRSDASASVEQCVTAGAQSEREATFVGEMSAIVGSSRMEIRIDVLARMPGEPDYHAIVAPGLGVWRASSPGVKVYKYLRQVTDLPSPAFYRGAVRYRWLSAKGRQIGTTELRTPRCEQPPLPESAPATTSSGSPNG